VGLHEESIETELIAQSLDAGLAGVSAENVIPVP
jgi:hypothetical protein